MKLKRGHTFRTGINGITGQVVGPKIFSPMRIRASTLSIVGRYSMVTVPVGGSLMPHLGIQLVVTTLYIAPLGVVFAYKKTVRQLSELLDAHPMSSRPLRVLLVHAVFVQDLLVLQTPQLALLVRLNAPPVVVVRACFIYALARPHTPVDRLVIDAVTAELERSNEVGLGCYGK
eukprot:170574_1